MRREARGGNVAITPPRSGIRLKEYLREDLNTRVLTIAVTRFVEIAEEDHARSG